MATIRTVAAVSAALLSVVALFYKPIVVRIEVLGLTRPLNKIHNVHGQDLRKLPDTLYCEDLHYHEHSHLLFGASEENPDARWLWFPPYVEPHILVLILCALFSDRIGLYYVPALPNSMALMLWIEVLSSLWILKYGDTNMLQSDSEPYFFGDPDRS